AADTQANAAPIVTVAKVRQSPAVEEIVLPGQVRARYETPIYARTNGYVRRWLTDIGAHVKAGQLLAEIETPEVDQQLHQAEADLKTAQANDVVAQATAKRVRALLPTQSVSKEQDDQASSDAAARASSVVSNQANVERLKRLVGFERVVAPYDGVVTARATDIGDLINSGSGQGAELFRLADEKTLRIYVQAPQTYAALIRAGAEASLKFPEYPGREFKAVLVRTAQAIDPTDQTLLVELEADNANGELFPGGYTEVHFKLPVARRASVVSANALLFRSEGLRVATVGADGRAVLKAVQIGHDLGTDVEIVDGLGPQEQVILSPPASIETGDRVRIATATRQAPR
ncbi:MAG: efflux RND transporter periplasmic adaptor subunit, partial [Caulobacteraceae bacterium]